MPADLTTRIKAIQKQIGISQSGAIDIPTCITLETKLNIKVNSTVLTTHVKAIQKSLNIVSDGIIGPVTISRIEVFINPALPEIPNGASMIVSSTSLDTLIRYEVTSEKVYNEKYQSPIWAGGDSGVTIGIGYDCGYCSKKTLSNDWGKYLSAKDIASLSVCCGVKGVKAKDLLSGVKSVKVPFATAKQVFYSTTISACARDVRKVYPGVEKLPPDAQGALLSLIYNRGPLINDTDRRKEMKALMPIIAEGNLAAIAEQLRSMKRLWDAKTQKGLINRREQEALMVENASFDFLPENIVTV